MKPEEDGPAVQSSVSSPVQIPVATPPDYTAPSVTPPVPVAPAGQAPVRPPVQEDEGEALSLESEPVSEIVEPTELSFGASGQAPEVPGGGTGLPVAPVTVSPPPKKEQFSPFSFNKRAFAITGMALLLLFLLGAGSFFFLGRDGGDNDSANGQGSGYAVGSQLQLDKVNGGQLKVGDASSLTINGKLQVSNTLVLTPTSAPVSPVTGQIYYDQATNAPYYYDGTRFISLAPQNGVVSLGGSNGIIGLGNGLTVVGNQLSLSAALLQQINGGGGARVTSLQGQTGAVQLVGGPGIGINGTTISNSGVVSIVSGSGNLSVVNDGNGNYTLTVTAGGSTITGSGTAGHIAKFDAATNIVDSNLTESGSTLTYAGNLVVNAANGFVGNLVNLAVNGSSKLTVNHDGDSVQAGTLTVNGTGASSIAGSLSVGTGLTVTTGGINATGNSLINGTLTGLTGLTSGGTITFSGLNSNGVVHTNGSGVLSTGPVLLGTDTSGDYVANLGSLTGLTTTGNSGEGSTPTLSVTYGSGANTAVQGNTQLTVTAGTGLSGGSVITLGAGGSVSLDVDYGSIAGTAVQGNTVLTCASGVGNLGGGGNAVTLGAGGSCNNITITNSPTFSGTLAVQGAGGITTGVANTTTGVLNLANAGSANLGTLQVAALGQATTYTLPDPGLASVDICLSTGNCAGSGGGIVGAGTPGQIAKFTASNTIADSTLSESGSTLTASGNMVIQGSSSLTLGTSSSNTGAIVFRNSSNANTLTLQSGATGSNISLTLPTTDGNNGDCLQSDGNGVLSFQSCTGGPGGGVTSLDGLFGVLTLANSSGVGSTITIDNAAADGTTKGIAAFNSTNFSASSGVINTIQNIATGSSPTFAGLTLSSPLTVANGGTGANTLALNGVLYGNGTSAIQATSAAANSVLVTNGSNVPSLSQILPTAVQGNITTTGALSSGSITSGFGSISTGNLISTTSSLHGNTLTVGSSNQFQVDASGNFTTSGTGAIQAAGGLTLGNPGVTNGSLNLANSSSARQVILQGLNPSGAGNATIQLPTIAGGSTDTVCLLTLANCVGAGGSIAGTGTPGQIAKFTASNTIADSNLSESGSTLTYDGNLVVDAANGFVGNLINLEVDGSSKLTVNELGNSVQAGTLTVNGVGASSIAGTLSVGTLGANGTTALCSNAGVISTCASTGSIGYWNRTGTTLQPATAGDNITTSGNLSTTGSGTLSVAGTSALLGNVSVGTASANTSLTVYNGDESLTQTDFTQALNKGGINIVTDFTDGAYTPGIFWSTQNNNSTKPKAGIYMHEDGSFGTSLLFGTSNAYATGITNTALRLGPSGEATFKNGTNSATGFQVQNAAGTGLLTVNTSTGATLTSTLFVDTLGTGGTTAVCWNGSSQISSCASTGSIGFWNRTGTTLQPATAGDNITTSGNLSTTGSGTLSVAGTSTLTGKVGIGVAPTSNQLEVQGGSGVTVGISTTTNLNGDSAYLQVNNRARFGFSNGNIIIDDNAANKGLNVNINGGTPLSLAATTGAALFKNVSNSTTAFQIQNSTGTALFTADTSNNRIGIGAAPLASYELYVQSNADATLRAKNIGSANILELANNTADVMTVLNSGATTHRTTTNSTTAFQIQNAAGTALMTADTSNLRVNVVGDVNVGTDFGNLFFSDNFEIGTLGLWSDGISGAIDTSTTQAHDGKYSAHINPAGAAAWAYTPLGLNSTTYARAWVYVNSQTSGTMELFNLESAGAGFWKIERTGGNLHFYNGVTSTDTNSGVALSTGAWNMIEMRVTIGAGTGTSQVWLNGTQVVNLTSQNNGADQIENMAIGDTNNHTFDLYVDDVAVDNGPTGTAASLNVDDSLHVAGSATFGASALLDTTDTGSNAYLTLNTDADFISGIKLYETNDRGFHLQYDGDAAVFQLQANDAGSIHTAMGVSRGDSSVFFQNSSNSTGAFVVQNATGNTVFNVDTTNRFVGINVDTPETDIQICGSGSNCSEARLSFGDYDPVAFHGVFVGEYGTGDTDIIQIQGSDGTNITTGDLAANVGLSVRPNGANSTYVGINTDSPANKLDIRRDVEADEENGIRLQTLDGQDWKMYQPQGSSNFRLWTDGNGGDVLDIDTDGETHINAASGDVLVLNNDTVGATDAWMQYEIEGAELWESGVTTSGVYYLYNDPAGELGLTVDGNSDVEVGNGLLRVNFSNDPAFVVEDDGGTDVFEVDTSGGAGNTAVTIGNGTPIEKVLHFASNFDPAAVAAVNVTCATVTVTGAATSDTIVANPDPNDLNNAFSWHGARVSASNTVEACFQISVGGSTDPGNAITVFGIIITP